MHDGQPITNFETNETFRVARDQSGTLYIAKWHAETPTTGIPPVTSDINEAMKFSSIQELRAVATLPYLAGYPWYARLVNITVTDGGFVQGTGLDSVASAQQPGGGPGGGQGQGGA